MFQSLLALLCTHVKSTLPSDLWMVLKCTYCKKSDKQQMKCLQRQMIRLAIETKFCSVEPTCCSMHPFCFIGHSWYIPK